MQLEGGQELVGVGVDAQVEDLEAGALEHHPDEVLADVVDVALDGADDDLADRLGAGLGQQRPQDGHAGLHRVGGEQDLGHEQDAVAEVDARRSSCPATRASSRTRVAVQPRPSRMFVPSHDLGGHAVVEVVVHLLGQLVVGQGREIDLRVLVLGHAGRPPGATVGSAMRNGAV